MKATDAYHLYNATLFMINLNMAFSLFRRTREHRGGVSSLVFASYHRGSDDVTFSGNGVHAELKGGRNAHHCERRRVDWCAPGRSTLDRQRLRAVPAPRGRSSRSLLPAFALPGNGRSGPFRVTPPRAGSGVKAVLLPNSAVKPLSSGMGI